MLLLASSLFQRSHSSHSHSALLLRTLAGIGAADLLFSLSFILAQLARGQVGSSLGRLGPAVCSASAILNEYSSMVASLMSALFAFYLQSAYAEERAVTSPGSFARHIAAAWLVPLALEAALALLIFLPDGLLHAEHDLPWCHWRCTRDAPLAGRARV